jgi:hypothetical protein
MDVGEITAGKVDEIAVANRLMRDCVGDCVGVTI